MAWAMSSCGGLAQPAPVYFRRKKWFGFAARLKSKDLEISQLQAEILQLRTALNAQISGPTRWP